MGLGLALCLAAISALAVAPTLRGLRPPID
jgi:hypothetical protein